jgi:hypothetical protein
MLSNKVVRVASIDLAVTIIGIETRLVAWTAK